MNIKERMIFWNQYIYIVFLTVIVSVDIFGSSFKITNEII